MRPVIAPHPPAPNSATTPRREAAGKRLLLDAATRLAARQGSTRALGIRELAREAGLNHNTFYRHFDSIEAMVHSLLERFRQELREGIRAARAQVPLGVPPSRVVIGWLFDFAQTHPDIFTVAFREQFGPPGPGRDAVVGMLAQLCDDMVADLAHRAPLATAHPHELRRLLAIVIDHDFKLCLRYLEAPDAREALLDEAELLYRTLLAGALATLTTGADQPGKTR